MPRFVHILWITLLGLLLAACARDVNVDVEEDPYPDQVRIAFNTRSAFSSDYWYYMVFNYSAAPSTADSLAPIDEISDENRCANWEMYIGYHKDAVTGDQLITLQRPRVPTILDCANTPVDIASGQLTDDAVPDLLVACAGSDVVQLIRGIDPDPNDPLYFEAAEDFNTGPHPLSLHVEDYMADGSADVCIIYAGRGSEPAVLRVLSQTGNGVFTALDDMPITDTPVAAVARDLNQDGAADWVILTRNAETEDMNVRVFGNNGNGEFIASSTHPVADTARQVICGQVNTEGVDILVAQQGPDGGTGSIAILNGDGVGNFTTGPTVNIDGNVHSIALGTFVTNAIHSLLVCYTNTEGANRVGLWLNDGSQNFTQQSALVTPTDAKYITAFDTNNDNVPDAVILDGDPATNFGNTLYIVRGKRVVNTATSEVTFEWDDTLIDYLTGDAPTAVIPIDLTGNGVEDLLIPNSGSTTNGDSICVFHGLGHTNYTNADVYWTDELPELLGNRDWLLDQRISANVMEITIDPAVFYDLARVPPERGRGFNVTFMTTTTGVHYEANQDYLGIVRDVLTHPINVPMDVGHYDDDQNTPLADVNVDPDPSADIEDWVVEVR